MAFKEVSAIYKCMDILDLLARNNAPVGISEIVAATGLNKSTVYNILHSLVDLTVLHKTGGKYYFGPKFFLLGQAIDYESLLSSRVQPLLESFTERTRLTTSLGIRSGLKLIVLNRTVVPGGIDVINKSKSRPLLDGVHGMAALSLLPDSEIEAILDRSELEKFTPKTLTDKRRYLRRIEDIRQTGWATEREEYHPGIWAAAVAFMVPFLGTQAVIWTFGLDARISDENIRAHAASLRSMVDRIEAESRVMNGSWATAAAADEIRDSSGLRGGRSPPQVERHAGQTARLRSPARKTVPDKPKTAGSIPARSAKHPSR